MKMMLLGVLIVSSVAAIADEMIFEIKLRDTQ